MPSPSDIAAETIASLRQRYDCGEPLAALAGTLTVSLGTFARYRKIWGWPSRRVRKATGKSKRAKATARSAKPDAETSTPRDHKEWALRLHARILDVCDAELAAIEGAPAGESRARALAALTRTMASVRASMIAVENEITGKRRDEPSDEPPVDIAELRHELARRLHNLCESGETS